MRTTVLQTTACAIVAASAVSLVVSSAAAGDLLPECTVDFDGVCPNFVPQCGALFSGGAGCAFDFLPFCYWVGKYSYKVTPATSPATITLDGDMVSIEVYFAHVSNASGTMRFFDDDGEEVGEPLLTNGNCLLIMPPLQLAVFDEPVRSIEISAAGGAVYIDYLTVNPVIPEPPTPGDLTGDGTVGVDDLLMLLAEWGDCRDCNDCPADLTGDCAVGVDDLLILLANWTG